METIGQQVSRALAQAAGQRTPGRQPGTPMPEPFESRWREQLSQFKTFRDPDLEEMARATTEFVSAVQSRQCEPYWLSLLGKSGTGKTMLAKLAMRFISRNCLLFSPGYGINLTDQAVAMKWPEMVQEMKKGNSEDADFLCDKERKWDGVRACTCAYAFIDDIGQVEDAQKTYLLAALSRIADARLGAWTIWTSNLYLSQLAETVDPRISSRMIRGANVVIENSCIDFNLR